jgi:S1-C subfamily serine protease
MLKKLMLLSLFTLSTVSGLFVSIKGKYIHEQTLFNYMNPKVVKVTNLAEQGSGTGSQVRLPSGNNIILTNRHVCELRDEDGLMTLIDFAGVRHRRPVLKIDTEHDLCAIAAIDVKGEAIRIGDPLIVSDHVFVVGHPRGRATSLTSGQIVELNYKATINYGSPRPGEVCWGESVSLDAILDKMGVTDPNMRQFMKMLLGYQDFCMKTLNSTVTTAPGEPGNSGSPVVDFYGRLIGVLYAGESESALNSILVPFEDVNKFLQSIDL